jgi:coniferyl-aldehyde dehydrogenase
MVAVPPAFPELAARFAAQRRAFAAEPFPTEAVRRERLGRLLALIDDNEAAFIAAVDADFGGRAAQETRVAELLVTRFAVLNARRRLRSWMKVRRVATQWHFRPGRNRLAPQPLGVIGIVSPWNYPILLSLSPLVGALAAGNRVLIKPSELAPRVAALLAELSAKYFDPDVVSIIIGDAETAKAFVALPFDHLLFTGSTAVGRQVALAAAAKLTPTTLELSGKSPAIFDASCNLTRASARLAAGKLLNAGQTCIAPDYLLVPRGQSERVAAALRRAVGRLYPKLAANPDYTAILSDRHRKRLVHLLSEARQAGARIEEINPASESFADSRKLAPTLVFGAPETTRLMREEIFGPLLPVVEYDDVGDAIAYVNRGERPLALYWFGSDAARRDRVLRETVAGGVTINDCVLHIAQDNQPYGGVGASGMGAYHGEHGFRTFSKMKPVFHQSNLSGASLLRPPYGKLFDWIVDKLKRYG